MPITCDKCKAYGLSFNATSLTPFDYIEGKKSADIWIIGLNPKGEIGFNEQRTISDLENFNPDSHPYFHDFKKVSPKMYENWKSKLSRVAHTDLVKCFAKEFPPKIIKNNREVKLNVKPVISNCKEILIQQLYKYRPRVIICNGSHISKEMISIFPPKSPINTEIITSYKVTHNLQSQQVYNFWIILSGFIGRIDDRNKRRLGLEIENIFRKEKIRL